MNRRRWMCTALFALIPPTLAMAVDSAPAPGDEIIVCGKRVHIGAPVVTWKDPGGYDAYNLDRRFPGLAKAGAPAKVAAGYSFRKAAAVPPGVLEKAKAEGWDLPALQQAVDQFVIHYDVCGTSARCFRVLHDERGLSVHFMLDLDGTIYQTLDLQENAWHATKANSRSIGIEIANMGAVPHDEAAAHFGRWYETKGGKTAITVPGPAEMDGVRDRSVVLKPSRDEPVVGQVQGLTLEQYDLTEPQYASLIKLTAALCKTFPKIEPKAPLGADGKVLPVALPAAEYDAYRGILGHYHVQTNKQDPGPAFRWDRLLDGVKAAGK